MPPDVTSDLISQLESKAASAPDSGSKIKAYFELGNAHSTQASYEKAISSFEQIIHIASQEKDDLMKAGGFLEMGRTYNAVQEFNKSLRCLNRSLHIFNNLAQKEKVIDTLRTMGVVYTQVGYKETAEQSFTEAVSMLPDIENEMLKAELYIDYANFLCQQRKFDEGIANLEKSEKILESLGDNIRLARVHNSLGMAQLDQIQDRKSGASGDLSHKASVHFQKSIELSESVGFSQGIDYAMVNLAHSLAEEGLLERAREVNEQARRRVEKHNPNLLLGTSSNEAIILKGEKKFDKARIEMDTAILGYSDLDMADNEALILIEKGFLELEVGEKDAAREAFQRASRLFESMAYYIEVERIEELLKTL